MIYKEMTIEKLLQSLKGCKATIDGKKVIIGDLRKNVDSVELVLWERKLK